MYSWCRNNSQDDIKQCHTVVDWCNFFRYEAENYMERNSGMIGRFDAAGNSVVVEVDERVFPQKVPQVRGYLRPQSVHL